jgi:UDP-MurNAc hydroxylase
MRVTNIGHAGLFLETAAGTVLCDPWFNPAYFASWFPFPANDGLDPQLREAMARPDYLYVSHLHRDHFDPAFLREHVSKDTTVLLPAYPMDHLRRALEDLGFRHFVQTRSAEPVELDGGLRVMIVALTAPNDGPIGDSCLSVDDGTAAILNQNDARPPDLEALARFGAYDGQWLQFSGAIWYPAVYDLAEKAKIALGNQKRRNGSTAPGATSRRSARSTSSRTPAPRPSSTTSCGSSTTSVSRATRSPTPRCSWTTCASTASPTPTC